MVSDKYILDLIRKSVGYKTTVGPIDKAKVDKTLAGFTTAKPSSYLGQAAWELAKRVAATTPPPPPPPPLPRYAPQTYNRGSSGQDARYCTAGLPQVGGYYVDAKGVRYDAGGREVDGARSGSPVQGLKPADEMDGREPCDPYNGFPPWPAASYER